MWSHDAHLNHSWSLPGLLGGNTSIRVPSQRGQKAWVRCEKGGRRASPESAGMARHRIKNDARSCIRAPLAPLMAPEEGKMENDDTRTPRPGPDTEAAPGERRPADDVTGSQTGTIGGGGRDAHNPSPVRATGTDDEIVGSEGAGSDADFDSEEFDEEDLEDEGADAEESERE
jgi:hypothetical protein